MVRAVQATGLDTGRLLSTYLSMGVSAAREEEGHFAFALSMEAVLPEVSALLNARVSAL